MASRRMGLIYKDWQGDKCKLTGNIIIRPWGPAPMEALYCPEADRGMRFDDLALGVKWPVAVSTAVLADKDMRLPLLADIQPYEA